MIFKICSRDEWTAAVRDGVYAGSANDKKDGFIHFSKAEQVAGTLAKYYADADELLLVAVSEPSLGAALKWEKSRDDALFPHLYGSLTLEPVRWVKPLSRGADGAFILPEECR